MIENTGEQVTQEVFSTTIDDVCGGAKSIDNRNFPWEKLFVVGYGPGRAVEGREEYTEYRNVDAVYTLFRYDQPLQSPELAWRRLQSAAAEKAAPRKKALAQGSICKSKICSTTFWIFSTVNLRSCDPKAYISRESRALNR